MKVDPRSFKGLSRFLSPSAGGPLADRALAEKIITADQLHDCVDEQDRTGRPLDEILVARGHLKADEVVRLRLPALPREAVEALSDPKRILGQYVLASLLGTGGMAEVWKAWDRSLGRWVAVKVLKEEIGHPSQRIEREGRMAGGLSHPAIITIFERGQHDGRAYLVMPFVDGRPPRSPLPPREAARLVHDVSQALVHAHAQGVIHRDVKPANILVEAGGRVVLADFGLAIQDDTATSRWAVSGTPEFASPEQIRGDVLDARTDVYSLGATLYQLLSGRPPFTGRDPEEITSKVLRDPVVPLKGTPEALARIVSRAMERERARRTPTMAAFEAELRGWIASQSKVRKFSPAALALVLVAGAVPWVITGIVLWRRQAVEEKRWVLGPLSEAQRELGRAEQARSDPEAPPDAVPSAVARAIPYFKEALLLADNELPDASYGLGRCFELIGRETEAEREYRKAGPLPAARIARARCWLRRHFDGRTEYDWRGAAQEELRDLLARGDDPALLLRAYASGHGEQVLELAAATLDRDRYDDVLWTAAGLAGIELGRWEDALLRLEHAARLRRRDATSLYWKGVAAAGKGDGPVARESFTEAIAAAPPGWLFLIDAQARLDDLR